MHHFRNPFNDKKSKSWNFSPLIVKWNRGKLKAFGHKTDMCFGFLFPPWKYLNCNPDSLLSHSFSRCEITCGKFSKLVQKDMWQEWKVSRILNRNNGIWYKERACKVGTDFCHLVANRSLVSCMGYSILFDRTCYHMAFETRKE